MRDLVSRIAHFVAHFVALLTATPAAVNIDRRGFESLTLFLQTGVGGITFTGTNRLDWIVTHSDDGVTFEPVTTGHIVAANGTMLTVAANGVVEAYTAAKAAATTGQYGYVGDRRFVRATPTFGGTHATGTLVGALAVLGHAQNSPAV